MTTSAPPYDGDPYSIAEWIDGDDRRHVQLEMWRAVPSAVHMTRRSMWTNEAAVAYVAWVNATRVMIQDIMRREDIQAFEQRRLKLRARIELAPLITHRHYPSGRVGEVKTHPARERDLKNLVWALEDALQGALFGNDKWVDSWQASKREAPESKFIAEVSYAR